MTAQHPTLFGANTTGSPNASAPSVKRVGAAFRPGILDPPPQSAMVIALMVSEPRNPDDQQRQPGSYRAALGV
jgi:hypothetical protein